MNRPAKVASFPSVPKKAHSRRKSRPRRRTNPPKQSKKVVLAPGNPPQPHTCVQKIETLAPQSVQVDPARSGEWCTAPFNPEQCELLLKQEVFADFCMQGKADVAYARFKRTNQTNVYLALCMYGVLRDRPALTALTYSFLVKNCRAIALQKGLRNRGQLNDEVYITACDDLVSETMRAFHTDLDTARLLLENKLPDGRVANFAMVLSQRLVRALGYELWRRQEAARLADSIDELFPGDLEILEFGEVDGLAATRAAQQPDGVGEIQDWRDYGAGQRPSFNNLTDVCASAEITESHESPWYLVQIIDRLRAGLTYRQQALWVAASHVTTEKGTKWEEFLPVFADPATGIAPTTAALRQEFSRLRARLKRKYRAITGLEHPTALLEKTLKNLSQNEDSTAKNM